MLDLSPEIENTVLEYAADEGVSVNELITRAFPPRQQQQPATAETPEQTKQRVFGLLAKWQAKNPLPVPPGGFKTLAGLRAEWAAEDANKTEEERAAEDAFWEAHNRAIINSPGVSI